LIATQRGLKKKGPEARILVITTKQEAEDSNPMSNDNLLTTVIEALSSNDSDGMKNLLESVLNAAMRAERDKALNAAPYERSDERQGYANGFKPKALNSRMGGLSLQIPQTRGIAFYPGCLEKGLRSEKALKLAVAEMYLKGVSTRKVEAITQELCGLDISSTQVSRMTAELDEEFEAFRNRPLGVFRYLVLDAVYLKVRHSGTVIDQAVLVAYGINAFGRREILGASISLSEAEVHWRSFLESLQQRGLTGLQLITSDDHAGLKAALRSVFPSVAWQRCQFHMSQNAQHYAPKKHLREDIARAMRDIFNSPSLESAHHTVKVVSKEFEHSAPEFVQWLDTNIEEGLTCYHFPRKHRRRIRTSNGAERINREIKRRTRVAVLFPNSESALRLVTAILMDIHEDWVTGKVYLNMEGEDDNYETRVLAM
jgi:transposase-like protein